MKVYAVDKAISLIFHRVIYHQPFEENTLSSFPVYYRSAVANNLLSIVEIYLFFMNQTQKLLIKFVVL